MYNTFFEANIFGPSLSSQCPHVDTMKHFWMLECSSWWSTCLNYSCSLHLRSFITADTAHHFFGLWKAVNHALLPCLLNHEHIFFLNQTHLFWVFHTFFTRSLELEEIPHHVIDSFTLTWFSQMQLPLYLTLLSVFSPWGYSFSWKPLDKEDHALTEFYKERTMEETFVPFEGIKNDLRGRLRCYKQDWTGGIRAGYR